MTDPLTITIDDAAVQAAFRRLMEFGRDPSPMMAEIAATLSDIDLHFVNQGEGAGTIRDYLMRENIAIAPLTDHASQMMQHFRAVGLPATLFIDANGRLHAAHLGEISRPALLAAIEDPDPVFFLEAIKLYRSERQAVPEGHFTFELGKARIVRPGNAVSLFCYGGMVEVCMKAAEVAAREGVELEVVDLETLAPLDEATILDSVRRTGRAVIVYEAPRSGGFGAEVAARIAEEAIYHLEAPIVRVTGWDAPYPPFTSVEHHYRPDARRVLAAVRKVLQ